jgi:hypothetical protein
LDLCSEEKASGRKPQAEYQDRENFKMTAAEPAARMRLRASAHPCRAGTATAALDAKKARDG